MELFLTYIEGARGMDVFVIDIEGARVIG